MFCGEKEKFLASMNGFGALTTVNSPFTFGQLDAVFASTVSQECVVLGGILPWQDQVPANEETIRNVVAGYLSLPLLGLGAGGLFRVFLVGPRLRRCRHEIQPPQDRVAAGAAISDWRDCPECLQVVSLAMVIDISQLRHQIG
ncbi:MAG: hypothetical protein ABI693_29790 [Bryobacteraceae bacterium]